jgi:polar amino acid transport system substrate-binding protein
VIKTAKRILVVLVAVALFAFGLTGCSRQLNIGRAKESHLDKVIRMKKIRIAVLPDNPGWSIMKANGSFEGFDVDIAKDLANVLAAKIEFVSTDGPNRITLAQADKVDVVIAGFTAVNERAKLINFTEPYAAAGSLALYKKSNPISSWDDLKNKRIAVARGSTADIMVTNDYPNAKISRFDTIADVLMALKTDKVDALIEDDSQVFYFEKTNPGMEALAGTPKNLAYSAMGLQKGDQEWLNFLNHYIRNLNYSGKTNELYKKWFGRDMPKLYTY